MHSSVFYKLPLNFDSAFEDTEKSMGRLTEKESIDQNIELLLTCSPGEHTFNPNFGCKIQEMDFERIISRKKWEDDFVAYILEAIQKFEPRVTETTVSIYIKEVTREDLALKTIAIKKKVCIFIESKLVSTNEICNFQYNLFLGPLSKE